MLTKTVTENSMESKIQKKPLKDKWLFEFKFILIVGVMDIFHADVGSNTIYCLYLQGIKAMNQKTALFVMINTPRRMDAS